MKRTANDDEIASPRNIPRATLGSGQCATKPERAVFEDAARTARR